VGTKVVFSSPFHPKKNLGFGPSFCRIELNNMQNFWQKYIQSPFWILASRGKKKSQKALTHPVKNLAF
jgi:hypothetical protein